MIISGIFNNAITRENINVYKMFKTAWSKFWAAKVKGRGRKTQPHFKGSITVYKFETTYTLLDIEANVDRWEIQIYSTNT